MRKRYRYPLLFLLLAATIGLFLRWQFVGPTAGIRFTWFVHSHSHVMFLGWVFNVLYLASIEFYLPESERRPFIILFQVLLALVAAMMITFPLQGYGTYSIIFSTLHTLAAMVFVITFLKRTARQPQVSLWFIRIGWIFFFISTAGPFSLGYLMANGLGQSVWYQYSIYYYLHFQYNGFFLFGILGLFYSLLEEKQIPFDAKRTRAFGILTAIACIPAFTLSILFAKPGPLVNLTGAIAGGLQLLAICIFFGVLKRIAGAISSAFSLTVRRVFLFALIALTLKLLLQLASSHPVVAELAYALRPVVIAYLHLVLVGIITLFLLGWYMERGFVRPQLSKSGITVLLAGFIGSEVCLVISPWWSKVAGDAVSPAYPVFAFSGLLWLGLLLFYLAFGQDNAAATAD